MGSGILTVLVVLFGSGVPNCLLYKSGELLCSLVQIGRDISVTEISDVFCQSFQRVDFLSM